MDYTNNYWTFKRTFAFFSLPFLFILSLSAQLPSGFVDTKIQSGYTTPMALVFSKNGQKMFVWEKSGLVWCSAWNGSTYVKQGNPTLDLREEVGDWRDMGLESMALDPNFDTNGLVYLFYQVDRHHLLYYGTPQYDATKDEYNNASISRVTRYKLNISDNTANADLGSRKVLLGESKSTGVPITFEGHAGGQIVFGTDGTLFVTTGDNASFLSNDIGNATESYYLQAINDGIMRSTENVGAFRAQMINSFCGKLLRLDPNTGDAVPSNPYYDAANPRSAKSRVWALGLRNPYRISFKTGTGSTNPADGNPGTVILGDVQYNSWEELNIVEKGGVNCGWPLFEGIETSPDFYNSGVVNQEESGNPTFQSLCVKGGLSTINNPTPSQRRYSHLAPSVDWSHTQNIARYPDYTKGSTEVPVVIGSAGALVGGPAFQGDCVTAGALYTGTAFPAKYQNTYFFADYVENWIKAANLQNNIQPLIRDVYSFAPPSYGKGIVDVEYCPADESIFYININTGDIQRISYGTGNRPPIAAIGADKVSGTSPLTVNLSSNGSFDPDGNPITYAWDFGDGTSGSTETNPTHTFNATGTRGFTVTLRVTDNQGLSDFKTLIVSANNTPPSVKITNPTNNGKYSIANATQLNLQSTVNDNDATGMQYAWQVTLRHNTHEHRDPIINQQNPTVQISPVGCDGNTYHYLIELQVTDNGGLTARDSVKIYPDCPTTTQLGCLTATYFNGRDLSGNPTTIRGESSINNEYVYGGPTGAGVGTDEFSVRWEGTVIPPTTGTYTFTVTADDGVRLWVNNVLVIDKWFPQSATVYEATVNLTQGQNVPIKMEYYEGDGRAFAKLFWTTPNQPSQVVAFNPCVVTVPPIQLGCLKASYFSNINLAGAPVAVRGESSINNDFIYGGPSVTGIGTDFFSVRWEGTVIPPITGTYTFTVTTDDGMRLWVNDVLVIDKWFSQSGTNYSANVNLTQGQNVSIKVEYYEGDGRAFAKLFWTIPNQASRVIAFNPCPVTANPPIFDPNKCYTILGRQSNKVMEVPNSSFTNGINIEQRTYVDGSKNQMWKLKDNGDGTFRIVNGNSGKVIQVDNASTAPETNAVQSDWNTGNHQRFSFTKNADGYYKMIAKHSNLPLEVRFSGVSDGIRIWQSVISGTAAQTFKVDEVGCPVGVVALQSPNILTAYGYREGKKSVIHWVSNANNASDYFMVQKLNANQPIFEKLTILNAQQGNTTDKNYYTIQDDEPIEGSNIYRIALFRNGAILPQYSEVIVLDFNHLTDYMLFPNPSDDYVDIDLEAVRYRVVDVTLVDVFGKVIKQQKIPSAPVAPFRLSLEGLPTGSYFLRIEAEGKREVVKKLVIAR